jgi:hypothetical protein
MKHTFFISLVVFCVICGLAGCLSSSPPSARSSCSFEQVWDTAIAALEGGKLESADKANGRIETAWLEVPSHSRAGLLERDINKERVKYIVEVLQDAAATAATVQQRREQWTPMGVRMRQWRAIRANSSEEMTLANEIARRLKEKGC